MFCRTIRHSGLRSARALNRAWIWATAASFILIVPSAAQANNPNQNYRYDSLGRLQRNCVARPGLGQLTTYTYDAADNRQSYVSTRTDVALHPNNGLASADGRFLLWMQPDGNLVLYIINSGTYTGLWATNTVGTGANVAYFQSDGNLVLYNSAGSVWSSNSYNNPCATLSVQNDGNVVITSADGVQVWTTNTGGH
jgi:hypothetical protein